MWHNGLIFAPLKGGGGCGKTLNYYLRGSVILRPSCGLTPDYKDDKGNIVYTLIIKEQQENRYPSELILKVHTPNCFQSITYFFSIVNTKK